MYAERTNLKPLRNLLIPPESLIFTQTIQPGQFPLCQQKIDDTDARRRMQRHDAPFSIHDTKKMCREEKKKCACRSEAEQAPR